MHASRGGEGETTREMIEMLLSRLDHVTRLLTRYPAEGHWDVRDYAIASMMLADLREVVARYREITSRLEAPLASAARDAQALLAAMDEKSGTPHRRS